MTKPNRTRHIKTEFEPLGEFDFCLSLNGYKITYNTLDYMHNGAYLRPLDNKIA